MDHMLSSLSGFSSLASCKTCVSTSLFCVCVCVRVFGQVVGEVCMLMQMHRSHDVFALYVCSCNEDKST